MFNKANLFSIHHIIVIGLVFLSGCVSVPVERNAVTPLRYVCEKAGATMAYDPVTRRVKINASQGQISLSIDSSCVWIDEDKVLLNGPVTLRDNEVFVPYDFEIKVFGMTPRTDRRPAASDVRIVIDAGHGGKDSGAVGQRGIQEKDIVLDIAKRVNRNLRQQGFDVIMTRSRDEFITLEKRTEIASSQCADIFVSIHANSSPARRASGFEVWSPRVLTSVDKNENQRIKNHQQMFTRMNMKKRDVVLERTLEELLYRHKKYSSEVLAQDVLKQCEHSLRSRNRGVKYSGFFVLRNTIIPSILVEVGFLSNSSEESLLNSNGYRQKIADAISDGIHDYTRRL